MAAQSAPPQEGGSAGRRASGFIRSNVLGLVAIFIALGGTAYATHSGGANTISSADIINGQVMTADINDTDGVRSADVRNDNLIGGGLAAVDLRPGAVATSELANGAVSTPKLGFDPATQPELDAHKSSAHHDDRYRTETELQTSDGSAPNTGSNFLHWNVLNGVPAGFVDGTDDTGGTASDVSCSGCVNVADIADGVALGEIADDDGSGSGLDADLLDGQSSADFAAAAHDHDDRYRTETELQTSDGSAPNTGSNFLHWNVLNGVPAGFVDGTDDTGGTASDVSCSGCVNAADIADGAALGEIADDDGSGSGLDADLLDGESSADFAAAAHDHDDRYRTQTELQTSDGSAPNTGSNFLHWNVLNGVPAGFVDGTDATGNDWSLTGNSGTNPATDFLGTTDNRALNLRVNNARGLRLAPASDGTNQSPNVIGGIADNSVTAGVHSAVIGGGGRGAPSLPASANRVTDHQGTVGGGANNQAGNGAGTVSDRTLATVGGGSGNTASGSRATVAGGEGNSASALRSTVGGGLANLANGLSATVGGGQSNIASGADTTVGGGRNNTASGSNATVGGGVNNTAIGNGAAVGGGDGNTASGSAATVLSGQDNSAAGNNSLAAGVRAEANHDGAFVWADSNVLTFASTGVNQFSVRSTGGARFVSAIDGSGNPTAGVTLASGGGSWASLSDEASKTAITPVSGGAVLRKLASVPISEWSYRAQGPSIRHIGPMAQDLSRAFGVGEDSRHITSIDADGIALAAIKGLNKKVRALQRLVRTPAGDSAGPSGDGSSLPAWALAALVALGLACAAALGAAVALRWQGGLRGSPATG